MEHFLELNSEEKICICYSSNNWANVALNAKLNSLDGDLPSGKYYELLSLLFQNNN